MPHNKKNKQGTKSSKKGRSNKHAAVHKQRGNERFGPIVQLFVKKSGLEPKYVEDTAHFVRMLAGIETPLEVEAGDSADLLALMARSGRKPKMWLRPFWFIGGDFCILNTQMIVQRMTSVSKGMELYRGQPVFDETDSPARRICGDLDDLFAGSIIPEIWKVLQI